MTQELDEFAKILIERIRDAAIQSNDMALIANHVIAKRWKEAASTRSAEDFAKMLIPDIVDSTISHLLGAIDQEHLHLSFTASNQKSLDLTTVAKENGELSGWYRGNNGWIEKYSKERYCDDFSDLKEFFKKASDDN